MSSYDGHFPIVEFLVENGADVNQATNDGFTSSLHEFSKWTFFHCGTFGTTWR